LIDYEIVVSTTLNHVNPLPSNMHYYWLTIKLLTTMVHLTTICDL